jgi:DNA-binding LacI/PurR family transcriptional regulator
MKSQFQIATLVIREWMARENFRPGLRLPARRKLAEQFGLSPAMVLRACQILIAEGRLYRDGYKLMVGSGVRNHPQIEGAVHVLSYYHDFARSSGRVLAERGINHRLTELTYLKHPNLEPTLRKVLAEKPCGVIIWTVELEEGAKSLLEKADIPVVFCADDAPSLKMSTVQTDVYRGARIALKYLFDLGHRHIACISLGQGAGSREMERCHRAICLELNLKSSLALVWNAETGTEEEVREKIEMGRQRHPEVTAFFCEDQIGVWATKFLSVPEEISIVGLGGTRDAIHCRPPLTTVALANPDCIALWACTEMIFQLEARQAGRWQKAPNHVFLVPELTARKSSRALTDRKTVSHSSQRLELARPHPSETWGNVYPFLKKGGSDHWLQLDLSRLANHSMTRQHGWMGEDPLEHFPPGLRSIHGVPFQVLDEKRNSGRAVISFRSPHSHSAGQKRLPITVRIKVSSPVKALYFLHGCGYARPVPFAEYIMHFSNGGASRVVLLPIGKARQAAFDRPDGLQPNLQDWWAGREQENFPHAHYVTVFDPTDLAAYERTLYSLEWINPRPQDEVSSIEICVDPIAGPTLAVIAITALL